MEILQSRPAQTQADLPQRDRPEIGRRHNHLERSLYFNSGCGVYRNGITAIELQAGEIRLIKWEYSDSYCAGDVFRRAENYLRISRKIVEAEKLKNIIP